jgi:crotonobetainyl-CoA:carnitine CoA-transferase CaiB-like acyl-CoA transferase
VVNERIRAFTRDKTVDELVELFSHHQVPHAPILGITAALAQPQAVAREMVVETEHAQLGKIPIVNRSIKFPGARQPAPLAPPALGQHTDEILRDVLGLTPDQIAKLRAASVVA